MLKHKCGTTRSISSQDAKIQLNLKHLICPLNFPPTPPTQQEPSVRERLTASPASQQETLAPH